MEYEKLLKEMRETLVKFDDLNNIEGAEDDIYRLKSYINTVDSCQKEIEDVTNYMNSLILSSQDILTKLKEYLENHEESADESTRSNK